MSRRLAVLIGLAAFVGAVSLAPVANAATYPPSDNSVFVVGGSTHISAGDEVDVTAQTFVAGSDVTFTISTPTSSLGSSRNGAIAVPQAASGTCESGSTCVRVADSAGVATASITFTQAGTHTITATGTGADQKPLTVTSSVTVAAASDGGSSADPTDAASANDDGGPGLPKTGTDLIKYGLIGVGLIALGTLVIVAARRRTPDTIA